MEETKVIHKKKVLAPKLRFREFSDSWLIKKLGPLVQINSGYTPSNYEFQDNGKYPFIKVEELNNSEKYQKISRFYSDDEQHVVKKNAVIFPKRGAAILNNKVRISAVDLLMDTNLMAVSPITEDLNHEFLYYKIFIEKLYKIADCSTIPQINNKHIEPYKLHLPKKEEQQKIASFLSAVDEKIQLLNRKMQLLEQYKKGVMQQLFSGKLRFKDKNGKAYPKWEEKKLGDLALRVGDGIHTTPNYDDNGSYYFVNGNNLTNGKIVINESTKKISESEYLKHNRELGKNTILFSINGTIGNIAFYNNEKIVLGKSACYINLCESVDLNFIYLILQSSATINYYNAELTGSTIRNLSLKTVRETPINLPCLEEQKKIADFLSAIDVKIESLSKQINQTQNFKKGLLQQMFV